MYKLGFTTLGSVQDRLAFQGKGHEKHIDKVLLFSFFEDGLTMERDLHLHFKKRALFQYEDAQMPFFANGQSELYSDDILELDAAFTDAQSGDTRQKITNATARRLGASESQIAQMNSARESGLSSQWQKGWGQAKGAKAPNTLGWRALGLLLKAILIPLNAILSFVFAIAYQTENSKTVEANATGHLFRIREAVAERNDRERIERQMTLNRLKRELLETESGKRT